MADVAILIGVAAPSSAEYPWGSFPPLGGVDNDLEAIRSMLRSTDFRLPTEQIITLLTPADTTRGNILDVVAREATQLGPGDTMVLYLDGHGYHVPDVSGDEADGLDEVFLASDRSILDDDFATIWAGTNDAATIIGLVDTCYAQTSGLEEIQPVLPIEVRSERGPSRLFFSASEPDQVAVEVSVRGKERGLFSKALEDAWLHIDGARTTYEQLLTATQELVCARATQSVRGTYRGSSLPDVLARQPFSFPPR